MSNKYEIKGTIILLSEIQTFGSGFKKREFVVETGDQYPQQIKLEAVRNAIDSLENAQPGNEVEVSFNIRGNEYNGRYYVNLQAFAVRLQGSAQETRATQPAPSEQPELPVQQAPATADIDDDIPF